MRFRRSFSLSWLALALAATSSCAELPDIARDVCGNAIVEAAEDCDGFARKGEPNTACRAPGEAMECHFDCTRNAAGSGPACPNGWACGSDSTCRPPGGIFVPVGEPFVADASWVRSGDFDGDGRSELVTSGNASLSVHYFDAAANLASSSALPPRRSPPAIGHLSGSSRSDLAFVLDELSGLGVVLGGADRKLIPKAYPTIALMPGIRARFVALLDETPLATQGSVRAAVLSSVAGTKTILIERVGIDGSGREVVGELAGSLDDAQIAVGHLQENLALASCQDVAIGFLEQRKLYVWSPCEPTGKPASRWSTAPPTPIDLPTGVLLQRGLTFYDANADGHLDLVIPAQLNGENYVVYVVYSDGAGGYLDELGQPMKTPLPVELDLGIIPEDSGRILALGDLDGRAVKGSPAGDPSIDLVTEFGVFLRTGKTLYPMVRWREDEPRWTEAVIGDFNRDGQLDVVASSNERIGVDYYAAVRDAFSGVTIFNHFVTPTDAFVEHLAVGDFDGDLVNDVAFSQLGAGKNGTDVPSLLFGRLAGAFEPPVRLGELGNISQVIAADLPLSDTDRMSDLVVLSESFADKAAERVDSVSAFLGNGDRFLLSPFGLISAGKDPVRGQRPLRTAIGHFAEGPALVTLTRDEVWISPSTEGGNMTTSVRTTQAGVAGGTLVAAADLDGDGMDEVILAMGPGPSCESDQTFLVTGDVKNGKFSPIGSASGCIDVPTSTTAAKFVAQLGVADLDGDNALDVLFLGGFDTKDGVKRLRILWNDGHGGLDFSRPTVMTLGETNSIESFTTVMAELGAPPKIVLTSKPSDRDASSPSGGTLMTGVTRRLDRSFSDPSPLGGAIAGIAITSGDFDGDGLADLAIADGQRVQLLRQERGSGLR
jgi:hypothetical protein